jgi:hypothetical protein
VKKKILLAASLLILITAPEQAKQAGTSPQKASPVTLKVLNPTGATEITELFTPRLADLNGKTVCEVNAGWEGDRTLTLVGELLKQLFPAVNIVSYTEFPGSRNDADHPKIMELVKKFKCDAIVVGNGG